MIRSIKFLAVFALVLSAAAYCAETRVNIVYQAGTSEAEKSRALIRSGGAPVGDLPAFNAITAIVPNHKALQALQSNPSVVLVEEDFVVETIRVTENATAKPGGSPVPQPSQVVPAGINRVDAEPAIASNGGAGARVAIVDTGILLNHPDLQANIVSSYNAIALGKTANDDNGHGTHVAGTVAAINNSIGVVGVAPNAKLMAVKVLDSNGSGYISNIAAGIDWATKNGAQVMNMSFGSSADSTVLHSAIQRAATAKVQIAAAAGNSGNAAPGGDTVGYPGRYVEVVCVSAWIDTDGIPGGFGVGTSYGADDTLATFSSTGAEVDITAPGVNVLSCWYNGGYATLSGTSMASPHVAGMLARIVASGSANPRGDLLAGVEKLSSIWTADKVGAGLLHKVP